MNTHLIKLEATVEGLKRVQDFTLVAVLGVGAILAGFSIYGLQSFDQLSDKLSDKVDQLSGEFDGKIDQLSGKVYGKIDELSQKFDGKIDQISQRVDGKIDQLSGKVNDIPSKISAELRDITKTLAESITAAKQQPPQVILIPAPPLQQKMDGQ